MRRDYYLEAAGARPRGVAEFTKTVAEFTKNASEGVLLLQKWEEFCKFAMSFQPKTEDSVQNEKRI